MITILVTFGVGVIVGILIATYLEHGAILLPDDE